MLAATARARQHQDSDHDGHDDDEDHESDHPGASVTLLGPEILLVLVFGRHVVREPIDDSVSLYPTWPRRAR